MTDRSTYREADTTGSSAMTPTVDSETLLYALGVAFALGTLAYFASEVAFELSITVTAALLLLAFLAFFVVGLAVDREPLDTVAFAVSGVAYVVCLGYVVSRYEPGEGVVFVLLAASAGLFVGLGYGLQDDRLAIDRRTAGFAVVALAAVGLLLVGADSLGGVEYSVDLDAETALTPTHDDPAETRVYTEQQIGTLTASNPTVFTRAIEPPSLSGCLAGVDTRNTSREGRVGVRYEPRSYERSNRLPRGGTRELAIEASAELPAETVADTRTIAVERGENCEATRSEPTIVVVVDQPDDR